MAKGFFISTRFTAQSRVIHALGRMHAKLKRSRSVHRADVTPFATFMAFTVEGYVNSIGFRVWPEWASIERKNWRVKINKLHALAAKAPNWSSEPLSFLVELFDIRDSLAHGKPETVRNGPYLTHAQARVSLSDALEKAAFEPRWYASLTKAWALSAMKRCSAALAYLAALHGLKQSDHREISSSRIESADGA